MAEEYVQVTWTIDDEEAALNLARIAVRRRKAACAQVGAAPIRCVYWWDGQVDSASEWAVTAKTTRSRLDQLIDLIRSNHPYETPEIIATPIVGGFGPYLDWVSEETAERASPVD